MNHKGWHRRGYLPHFDAPEAIQGVTFRLADSVPKSVIEKWKGDLHGEEEKEASQRLQGLIARFEDQGHGECPLKNDECAQIVEEVLLFSDGERYRLLEWCIMPNHVHVLVEIFEGWPLGRLVNIWKSLGARKINKLLGREGELWSLDYFDRYIRDQEHFEDARAYVRMNPVKAGLVQSPEDFRWSSAWKSGDGQSISA